MLDYSQQTMETFTMRIKQEVIIKYQTNKTPTLDLTMTHTVVPLVIQTEMEKRIKISLNQSNQYSTELNLSSFNIH